MSNQIDTAGDIPIDIAEPQFSLAEAAWLARIEPKTIRNLYHRGLLNVGFKNVINGRWLYSLEDALRLSVVHDLALRTNVCSQSDALIVANVVVDHARQSTRPGQRPEAGRPNVNIIVAWSETGELVAQTADIAEAGMYRPPPARPDGGFDPLRRAHVVLPATSLLIDLILRTREMLNPDQPASSESAEHADT